MDGRKRSVFEISQGGKVLFTAYLFPDNYTWWTSQQKRQEGYTLKQISA